MRLVRLASLTVSLFVVASLTADDKPEMVDNPAYVSWAKHKKGTPVVMKTTSESKIAKSVMTMTSTLLELDDAKAVIELKGTNEVNGMKFDTPPTKTELKKLMELPKGQKKGEAMKPEGFIAEGEETITIGKTEYKAKWTEVKMTSSGIEIKSKSWMSNEVPGMILKSNSDVGGMVPSKVTMELIEIKKP